MSTRDRARLLLRKLFAFLKRDALESSSYKLAFLFDAGGVLSSCLIFFFISKLIGPHAAPSLEEYGGSYFSFVILGIAFSGFMNAAMEAFSCSVIAEQGTGTLEAILITPTSLATVVLGGSLWNFLYASARVLIYLALGAVFFGLDLGGADVVSAALVLILTGAAFIGLGAASASFIMVFKRGDPVNAFIGGLSRFLGGVYFPIAMLPSWIQPVSYLLPMTYSLEALRMALLKGAGPWALRLHLLALALFAGGLLLLGLTGFRLALRRAMREGSLLHH